MKRFLIGAVTLAVISSSAIAGISIRPMVGYGFGIGKKAVGYDNEEDTDGNDVKNKVLYYSAGQGMKMGLGVDMSLLGGVGFGVDMGYSIGSECETGKHKDYDDFDSTWNTSTSKMKTSYLFLSPSVRMERTVMGLSPFCVFGLTLAMMPESEASTKSETSDQERKFTYNTGIGTCGAIGLKYSLMGLLGIVAEVRVNQLSLKASRSEMTKFTVNGKDALEDMPTRIKETEYREDDSEDDFSDQTKPNIDCTFMRSANSLSIRVGAVVSF
jgi:opacity protein-like surface antigen